MDDSSLTAGQLAEAIEASDFIQAPLRRIRHWTVTGLLEPVSGTHTGPGRHRRYARSTVYLVSLLNVLADMSLPIGVLKQAAKGILEIGVVTELHKRLLKVEPEAAKQEFYDFKSRERRLWDEAIAGSLQVFVAISFPAGDVEDGQLLNMITVGIHSTEEIHRATGVLVDGMIAINATRVFRRIALP